VLEQKQARPTAPCTLVHKLRALTCFFLLAVQPQLYQVLEQKQAPLAPGTLLGTDHVYVMPGQQQKKGGGIVSSVPGR